MLFYELAIRHAIRKPLVQIIEKGQRIPFDVAGTRTVHVDHKDLDSVSSAKEEIVRQIRQLEADPNDIETPISVSRDLQILKQSDNPKDRGIADLLSVMAEMRTEQSKLLEGIDKDSAEKFSLLLRRLEEFMDSNSFGFRRNRIPIRHIFKLQSQVDRDYNGVAGPGIVIAMAASMFKENMPWVFEIGMEAYRQQLYGDSVKAKLALQEFKKIARYTDHPMYREFTRNDKELMFLGEELDMVLSEIEHRQDSLVERSKGKSK